jgi:mRNA-degrading endonuclease RelE of RelBE toxin-antitoxin system
MPSRCPHAPESEQLQQDLKHLHYGKRTGSYRIVFKIVEDLREVHILSIRHAARKPLEIDDLD